VDVLAAGFAKAAARHPGLFLLLLGGGSQAEPIRSILQNAGVIDKVRFGGQVPYSDLIRWYHMADIFISPSHVDGSSVSLMEALACGVPALVSDIPANKEWVREGVNGWLFPDGDADALAQRILATSSSKSQLATIGRAARKVAEKRADWGKNFRVLMRAYERTVKFK
jgi:glycosyltransferase involved in cell wall biosynthesis